MWRSGVHKKEQILWKIINVFGVFCAALAISMRFKAPELREDQILNVWFETLWNIHGSIAGTAVISTIIFCCFFKLAKHTGKVRTNIFLDFSCFVISVFWLMAESFRIDNTLWAIHSSLGQVVKSVVYVIGITWLLRHAAILLYELMGKNGGYDWKVKKNGGRHSFLHLMLLLLLCWLPHILISYPFYGTSGLWDALGQFYGHMQFTAHFPPMFTLLIGCFSKLGIFLGNVNAGMYLFVLIQTVIAAMSISYAIYTMQKLMSAPRWLIVFSLIGAIFVPYYSGYVGVILRDNLYSYAVLVFVVEIFYMIMGDSSYFKSKGHCFLLGISMIEMIFFRKNGIYILYPMVGVLCIWLWRKTKKSDKKIRGVLLKAYIILIFPIICANAASYAVTVHYGIESGSIREAFSLPFQQTARYVCEYGDEVTEKEKAAISKVLDYESLAENYNPRISDPVKDTFNNSAAWEELKDYFYVWFRQLLKHPLVYLKATVNQNYYMIYPYVENNVVYTDMIDGYQAEIVNVMKEELNIHDTGWLLNFKMAVKVFYYVMFSFPVVGLMSSLAFYNLILIFLTIDCIQKKCMNWILFSVPLFLSNIIVLLAPVIQGHPRYALPIIYCTPFAVAYYLYLRNNEN